MAEEAYRKWQPNAWFAINGMGTQNDEVWIESVYF